MMKKYILLAGIFSLTATVFAQTNLVPNYSFEYTDKKPKKGVGEMILVSPWFSPDEENIPDLYSKEIKKEYTIPENVYGYQMVNNGQNYAGFRAYGYKEKLPRTFAEVKLTDGLVEGKSYCVSFDIALAKISKYASNNIGAYISSSKVRMKDIEAWTINPQIIHSQNKVHNDQYLWVTVCGVFKAQGGEKYLTIGNFHDQSDMDRGKENTERMKRPKGYTQLQTYDAYYYLDNVKVINLEELASCNCEEGDDANDMQVVYSENVSEDIDMEAASQIELEKLYYDQGKTTTNSPSAMVNVIRLLKDNEDLSVEIVGHCDKTEARENPEISMKRAEGIKEYLVGKGIDASRMSVKDAKATELIDETGTKAGDAQNRRVTFNAK